MVRILYVCTHNSARSQMAESYTRLFAEQLKKDVIVESAGLKSGILNKNVVSILQEEGIDISNKKTKNVMDLYAQNKEYDYVITVCSREVEALCPVFPGITERLNWPYDDPSEFSGSEEEIMIKTKQIRDKIKGKVYSFVKEIDY